MKHIDIKGLRPFASAGLIEEVIAQRSAVDDFWRASFKLKNGKKFVLVTTRNEERTYVKFETLVADVEGLFGKKFNKIKLV